MYLASVYPDRISVRYQAQEKDARTRWEEKQIVQEQNKINLEKKKTSWKLSYQTKKKMRDSVAYMSQMSKPRTIFRKQGKPIYNFKTSFITLTLPSKQIHTDKEIKQCLNNFLTTMRSRFNLKNYVWKAELQENENIHFHLIFDIFIEHTVLRYYWNKAINVLGYVDRYQAKMSKMSLQEYAEYRQIPISKAVNGFLFGNKTKWMSPGTEQVKSIYNDATASYYLSKYISKDVDSQEITEEEKQRISDFGRVWGRSQSLSRIGFVTRYCWTSLKRFIQSIDAKLESFTRVEYDYCVVFYFNFETITTNVRKWVRQKMTELAITYNYIAPT